MTNNETSTETNKEALIRIRKSNSLSYKLQDELCKILDIDTNCDWDPVHLHQEIIKRVKALN